MSINSKISAVNKIKNDKDMFLCNLVIFFRSIGVGILFAIAMIIIRCLALWILSLNSDVMFKEVINFRYYYGDESIKMLKYVDYLTPLFVDFLSPDSINIVNESGALGILDSILVLLSIIHYFIMIILSVPVFLLVPLLYILMKTICTIDSIIPLNWGIIYGWVIYSIIFGMVVTFIRTYIDYNARRKVRFLVLLTILICFIGIKFTGKTPLSEDFKNIKDLIVIIVR